MVDQRVSQHAPQSGSMNPVNAVPEEDLNMSNCVIAVLLLLLSFMFQKKINEDHWQSQIYVKDP